MNSFKYSRFRKFAGQGYHFMLDTYAYNFIRAVIFQIRNFREIKKVRDNFSTVWREQILNKVSWRKAGGQSIDEQINVKLLQNILDQYSDNHSNARFLEIGSHDGNAIQYFHKFNQIFLADIFEESLEYIKQNSLFFNSKNYHFIKLNGRNLSKNVANQKYNLNSIYFP